MGLSVSGLSVRYEAVTAVDDVSFQLETGAVLGLVGPSGCGKSTLLRTIAGLVDAAAGEISWDGDPLRDVPPHRRGFGLMFQDHALFSHRSVAQNIGFGLKMQGASAADRQTRVDELLRLVGLEDFGARPIEGLSGGEAQRVALARALAPEPKLLLLDEPLASLDRARRVELNAELARLLAELNQTAIYVTHDQDEAFSLADQVGVMHEGRLLRLGAPADVWRDPQSEVVARFIGHEAIVERMGHRFAVRADAITVAGAGEPADATGIVAGCSFQGDRHEVLATVDGATWRFFTPQQLTAGDQVSLRLDETRLAPLDEH